MAHISIALSSFLLILPTIYALPQSDNDSGYVVERNEWYRFKNLYTDRPRYFDSVEGCPHEIFYLDCNSCSCEAGAKAPACTLMECPDVPQIANFGVNGQGCPKGQKFYHQCNSCICNNDGQTAACTLKACIEPKE